MFQQFFNTGYDVSKFLLQGYLQMVTTEILILLLILFSK